MSKYDMSGGDAEMGNKEDMVETGQSKPRRILGYWRSYVILLVPLLLLPLPIIWQSSEMRCAYMIGVMAMYWLTEALPLAVTALIPVVAAPALGLMPSSKICPFYAKDTILLFLGGLMVAVAVEHWNLHKRIAIKVLSLVGTAPQGLMLGFMLATWFLSMWISNTATTAMMIPIVTAVVNEMRYSGSAVSSPDDDLDGDMDNIALENRGYVIDEQNPSNGTDDIHDIKKMEPESTSDLRQRSARNSIVSSTTAKKTEEEDKQFDQVSKMMSLSVCYAANCGGIATLTGTPPNLVLKGQLDVLFGDEHGISFSSWMVFGFPISILSLFFGWFWLLILFLGCKGTFGTCCNRENGAAIKAMIRKQYKDLGPWSFAEIVVLTSFIILALLWFLRAPGFIPGWGNLFKTKYVSDATAAISIAILLFILPSQLPNCCNKYLKAPVKPLLTWDIVTHKLPWNVCILLGGGFAMAETSKVSGLSAWVGQQLQALGVLPTPVIVLLISTIIAVLTEVTSNTATASLMLGIVAELAKNLCLNPLILMLPTTVSASFAFMLPVATPPNAIVFAYGNVRIKDMAIAGILMNIFCILLVTLAVNTWGMAYYQLDKFPSWANTTESPSNCTIGI